MVLKKSLWKQMSQAKNKQLVLEARKSFSNKALQILSSKLSDAKAIEELKEKAGAYFMESQARKAAQEVNKGQAGGVAAIDLPIVARKGKQLADPPISTKSVKAILSQAMVGLNQQLDFISKGIKVVSEKMRAWSTIFKTSFKSPSPPVQPALSTSSLPPVPASTLAPVAKAEEPNNDKAAQLKEDESEMDCTTAVAIAVNQSTIADNSALISNPITIVTDFIISSRSATESVAHTRPASSITDLAIVTDSVISTGPAAIITNSAITTGLAASNESTVPTGVETITGHLMDVDMIGLAPPHPPDEIVPQCGHSASQAT
ncbi:hypothetical protein C0989_007117 [Termitomyces sp. Mn162]|nr:hypothetical protein C0989_007117 [Termitomyces sp. Mn162]